jgi:small subunit ribosomal protein S13e
VILRDSHGIAQVKSVTGNKILRLLKKNGACPARRTRRLPSLPAVGSLFSCAQRQGRSRTLALYPLPPTPAGLAPSLPEDLYHLIKKAVSVRKHLERNRNDKDSKFRLILIESRIHRIARYYKTARQLPPNWRYESATASTLVA